MILNENTASHDFYQPNRQASKPRERRAPTPPSDLTGRRDRVADGLNCTLAEKCKWMREKQARKKQLRNVTKAVQRKL